MKAVWSMFQFSLKGIRRKRIVIKVNGRRVPVLILKPLSDPQNAPGVLWIHGGGYLTGMKEMVFFSRGAELVRNHGAVVITPSYQLSRLHP
jgi:acetyl esterase/lipase